MRLRKNIRRAAMVCIAAASGCTSHTSSLQSSGDNQAVAGRAAPALNRYSVGMLRNLASDRENWARCKAIDEQPLQLADIPADNPPSASQGGSAQSAPAPEATIPLPPPTPEVPPIQGAGPGAPASENPAAGAPATTTQPSPGAMPTFPLQEQGPTTVQQGIPRAAPSAFAPTATPAISAATQPAMAPGTIPSSRSNTVVVTSNLDLTREQIAPSLGAVSYTIGPEQIQQIPQGQNAPLQQVLLRAPGVVMDSFGQEHVRGEHGNLTYRINGIILPDALNGFGQELDTRIASSVTLIDGTLPAEFGFRTAGIVDVTTKTGSALKGNEISFYGGSYDTFEPSIEIGGVKGKWDYFITDSYRQDSLGIENPTPSREAIHDMTDQEKFFAYLAYNIDPTSRVTLLLSASYANFQIPNIPGQPMLYALPRIPDLPSADINESQNEQQYWGVLAYQKTLDDFSFQASLLSSFEQTHFMPDDTGDLLYQGVASQIVNPYVTNGMQFDSSWIVNDDHTIRAGFLADYIVERMDTSTDVFPVSATGAQASIFPFNIVDDARNHATMAGLYLQDEWRLEKNLTLNYGLRYDRFDSNFDDEGQVSPRANLVWKINSRTTAHAGYARYFVPPPVQYVSSATLAKFVGTTNAAPNLTDGPPLAERSNYFDVGVTRQVTEPWQITFDGFYKHARNLLDEGQFGTAFILSPYNYRTGQVYGTELSSTYKADRLSLFGNFAWTLTQGKDIDSQQFEFDPAELAYISTHDVKLDHESEFTVSAGASYDVTRSDRVSADILFSSGLRAGFANLEKEPSYYPLNLGYEHVFYPDGPRGNTVRFRFDIINVFDEVYQIRNGTGLGVNASQYGQRRTFLAGLAYDF